MRWTEVAAALGTETFIAGLKAAKRRVSKRRYKQLIATTVAQVLALHPDFGAKKARRRAEKMTGAAPSKKLIKTKKLAGGAGKLAEAAAASLLAGGAVKAVKAAGSKLASNGRTRRRATAARGRSASRAPAQRADKVDAGAESPIH
jgi:hypothetical protein